jgi:hypothetical protein
VKNIRTGTVCSLSPEIADPLSNRNIHHRPPAGLPIRLVTAHAFMCVKIACTFVGDVTVVSGQIVGLDGDKYNQLFDAGEKRRWVLNS